MGNISVINNKRESNIELFRIITMLLIVAHHYVVNSGLTVADGPVYANLMRGRSLYLLLLGAWGKTGINCFVLITGYFMCKSNITLKKFAKLFLEVMFYRWIIYAIFWISGYAPVTLKCLAKAIIPIYNISNGFVSTYLLFFLFIPFINILIHHMTEKIHIYILLLLGFMYIFLGTVPFFKVTMNYVSWFIVVYLIASYIRLYPKPIYGNKNFWGRMFVLSVFLSSVSVVFCAWLSVKLDRRLAYYFVTDSNTFLAVLTAVCAFMYFKNLNIRYGKFINTIAASTFGVLLIHAHSDIMRQWLWKDTLNNVGMYYSPCCYIHSIGAVFVIFAVCSLVDILRIKYIEMPFFNNIWDRKLTKYIAKVQKRLGVN